MVRSPAEAVRWLLANWPELEGHMREQFYEVRGDGEPLELELLPFPVAGTITITPVVSGAGATGRIIAGVALIGLSFAGLSLFGLALASPLMGIGVSLVLGGVAQLLTPTPRIDEGIKGNPKVGASYVFSGVTNTSRQGVPVPACYGEPIVGSVVISAGLSVA
jgi:predicted phage tail protein